MGNILILHIRFDIDAVEKKFNTRAYGMACYQTVFRNVPPDLLNGCQVSMGDSRATLNGLENVCIIGLAAPERRLQSIRKVLSQNREFLSVCTANPLTLETSFGSEPLVSDGIYTTDGGRLQMWAKSAYDLLKKEFPAQPAAPQSQPRPASQWQATQPAAQRQPQAQSYFQPAAPSQQPQFRQQPQQVLPRQQPVQSSPAGATYIDAAQEGTLRQRSGCLTAWIFLMILVNAGTGIFVIAMREKLRMSDSVITVQALISVAAVICGILILKWKRIGFYLMLALYIAGGIFALSIGIGWSSFSGIIGILILGGLLGKKTDGVSAWDQMKN